MKIHRRNRTAVLIVRLWSESNDRSGFRARITHTLDSASDEQASVAAATPEEVYAEVSKWVEAFMSQLPNQFVRGSEVLDIRDAVVTGGDQS